MKAELLSVDVIDIPSRFRKDYGDIEALCASMTTYGLIQPIVVDEHNVLVAGGRRLAAAFKLGWTHIPAYYREQLTDAQRREIELEENVRRKEMDWRERCMAIAEIHRLRSTTAALAGEPWGYDQTGELLGIAAKSNVSNALALAAALAAADTEVAESVTPKDALLVLANRKLREAATLYASRQVDVPTPEGVATVASNDEPVLGAPLRRSVTLKHADCLDWLRAQPDASLDIVYTDPPYAIDMDNLTQDNVGMRTELVAASHQVHENFSLIGEFIDVVTPKLKPNAFFVMWTDFTHLQWLEELADEHKLRFQRWPLIWVKTSVCMNTAVYANFTKATECAVLMAGPTAVLPVAAPTNYWIGAADKLNYNPTNPFWKPVALHEWVLSHIAPKSATIVDPFAGSGSIVLAAVRSGYAAIGIEKDAVHYTDLCKQLNVI